MNTPLLICLRRNSCSTFFMILMAERAKDQKKTEGDKLDALIQKHEELIPNVQ